jgi:hypothetical protein
MKTMEPAMTKLPDLPKEMSQKEKDFLSLAYLNHRASEKNLRLACFNALTKNNFPASPDMKFFLKNAQELYDWVIQEAEPKAPT